MREAVNLEGVRRAFAGCGFALCEVVGFAMAQCCSPRNEGRNTTHRCASPQERSGPLNEPAFWRSAVPDKEREPDENHHACGGCGCRQKRLRFARNLGDLPQHFTGLELLLQGVDARGGPHIEQEGGPRWHELWAHCHANPHRCQGVKPCAIPALGSREHSTQALLWERLIYQPARWVSVRAAPAEGQELQWGVHFTPAGPPPAWRAPRPLPAGLAPARRLVAQSRPRPVRPPASVIATALAEPPARLRPSALAQDPRPFPRDPTVPAVAPSRSAAPSASTAADHRRL